VYFNVSRLMMEPSGTSRAVEVDEELVSTQGGEAHRVIGNVKLLRTDLGVWVSAVMESEALCTCSRCLTEHLQPVHMTIEEEFLPVAGPDSGARARGLDGPAESSTINHDHILDLSETVRQYYDLSVPINPVCRNSCKGMCMTCGADLNRSICRCDSSARDGRWGPLLASAMPNKYSETDDE